MNGKTVLFGLEGRISRLPFWLGMLAILAVELAILVPAGFLRWDPASNPAPLSYRLLEFAVTLAVAYPSYAVMLKRLHDRDHPGAAAQALIVLLVVTDFINVIAPVETEDGYTLLGWMLMVPILILLIALIVELGFRRGTPGSNRFGADPLVSRP